MRGSQICLESNPRGKFLEGIINAGNTPYPGTAMQIVPASAETSGDFNWEVYQPGADNDPLLIAILLEDRFSGGIYSTQYAALTRCFLYVPLPGDYMNILVQPDSGT